MKIEYTDLVLLNAELKQKNTRYHLRYKDETTVCIEPPGSCSLTEDRKTNALRCIKEYYQKKNISVHFSDDPLFFTCEPL